jgi:hypothetical protein
MGDAAAHLTGADDAYPVNVHVRPLAFRAIPKNAPKPVCSTAKPLASTPPGAPFLGAPRSPASDFEHDLGRKACDFSASCR